MQSQWSINFSGQTADKVLSMVRMFQWQAVNRLEHWDQYLLINHYYQIFLGDIIILGIPYVNENESEIIC